MDQVPQNVDGQEVLNNVLADQPALLADNQPALLADNQPALLADNQPALLADNQPVDHNRGNHPAADAVVSTRLIFIRLGPIFHRLQAIYQRL